MESIKSNHAPRLAISRLICASLTVVIVCIVSLTGYLRRDSIREKWLESQSTEYLQSLDARTDADTQVHYALAIRLAGLGRVDEAISALSEAAKGLQDADGPEPARKVFAWLAYLNAESGRDADAESAIAAAQHAGCNDAMLHIAIGLQASRRRDFAGAIAEYTRAARLNPEMADAWSRLAAAWIEVAEPQQAIAPLHRAANLKPNDPQAHADLAEGLGRDAQFDEAAKECARAAELAPDNPMYAVLPAISRASSARSDADYNGALQMLTSAVQTFPQVDTLRAILAGLEARFGDYSQARAELETYLTTHASDSGAWLNLSSICDRLGDSQAASAALAKYQHLFDDQASQVELKKKTLLNPASTISQSAAGAAAQ